MPDGDDSSVPIPNCWLATWLAAGLVSSPLRNTCHSNLGFGLALAVTLWGGTNVGTKWLMAFWPPIFTGSTRFFLAGLLLLLVMRRTAWLGKLTPLSRAADRALWWRGGCSLALYTATFNYALRFTSASHVALYLGTAPVWALLWEAHAEGARINWIRWISALLAVGGVGVLLWPSLAGDGFRLSLPGELLGILASVLWANYGWQSRRFSVHLHSAEISAHTMWRAGVLLLPVGLAELTRRHLSVTLNLLGVQAFCIIAGGALAYGLWNRALTRWPTGRVLLFNNLIPVTTLLWAHFCLGEPITPTFLGALGLIGTGVLLGQSQPRCGGMTAA